MDLVRKDQPPVYAARITLVQLVEKTLQEHRNRYIVIDQALFREPAWDILLELFLAELKGERLSVSNACVSTNLPESTALRHLSNMEERGYIVRVRDENDRRRIYVELTQESLDRLRDYFDGISERWNFEIISDT